jgi:hypothetical protein
MSEIIRHLDPHSAEYAKDYSLGWKAGERAGEGVEGVLDRADARNVSHAWYDGYHDQAAGREKFAYRTARRLGFESPDALYAAEEAERAAAASVYEATKQAHANAAAAVESVPDANGQPIVLGARVRGDAHLAHITGHVESFDTRGQLPTGPIDVTRVGVWVRTDDKRACHFIGPNLVLVDDVTLVPVTPAHHAQLDKIQAQLAKLLGNLSAGVGLPDYAANKLRHAEWALEDLANDTTDVLAALQAAEQGDPGHSTKEDALQLNDTSRVVEVIDRGAIEWDTTGRAGIVATWLGNATEADRQKIRQAARQAARDGKVLRIESPDVLPLILGAVDNAGRFGIYVPSDHEDA